jgi:hypothetical protein
MERTDRSRAVPLADRMALQPAVRRTRLIQVTLAILLILAAVAAFLAAPRKPGRKFLPSDTTGIVVLDVSSSVKPTTYFRIEQTLATIAATQGRLGLVLFSDVAYEAFPPGTAAAELKPLLRFFAPETNKVDEKDQQLARTPWDQWFSAGTKVSNGLLLALRMIDEQHAKKSSVILISDLADDPTDLTRLTDAVLAFQNRKIPLEIVALDPTPSNADFFRRLLGDNAIFQEASLPTGAQARGQLQLTGTFSVALALFAVLTIALLTLNEWWATPLRWGRSTA